MHYKHVTKNVKATEAKPFGDNSPSIALGAWGTHALEHSSIGVEDDRDQQIRPGRRSIQMSMIRG